MTSTQGANVIAIFQYLGAHQFQRGWRIPERQCCRLETIDQLERSSTAYTERSGVERDYGNPGIFQLSDVRAIGAGIKNGDRCAFGVWPMRQHVRKGSLGPANIEILGDNENRRRGRRGSSERSHARPGEPKHGKLRSGS